METIKSCDVFKGNTLYADPYPGNLISFIRIEYIIMGAEGFGLRPLFYYRLLTIMRKGGCRMFKVTFSFEDGSVVEAFANAGDNLLEVARGANVAIDAPCSGNGACGKCRVQLKSGELESKKTLHISDEEYQEGWRLACCSKISADVNVLVLILHLPIRAE